MWDFLGRGGVTGMGLLGRLLLVFVFVVFGVGGGDWSGLLGCLGMGC